MNIYNCNMNLSSIIKKFDLIPTKPLHCRNMAFPFSISTFEAVDLQCPSIPGRAEINWWVEKGNYKVP